MKASYSPGISVQPRALPALLLAALLCLRLVTPALAEDHYLTPGHPDGAILLAPPPLPGSAEQAADLDLTRAAFKARTPQETSRAKETGTLAFSLFAPAIGPFFQLDKLPRTEALLKQVRTDIRDPINEAKNHFKRLRPYQVDADLDVGKHEPSFGYPSGHSSCGTVYGLVLAELFPEKKEAIMAIAYEIGWDRVILARHYLTDVRAGREFGQAIVREMLANPAFQRDLAAAKAEVQAAQH